eukprot:gene4075-8107_t
MLTLELVLTLTLELVLTLTLELVLTLTLTFVQVNNMTLALNFHAAVCSAAPSVAADVSTSVLWRVVPASENYYDEKVEFSPMKTINMQTILMDMVNYFSLKQGQFLFRLNSLAKLQLKLKKGF